MPNSLIDQFIGLTPGACFEIALYFCPYSFTLHRSIFDSLYFFFLPSIFFLSLPPSSYLLFFFPLTFVSYFMIGTHQVPPNFRLPSLLLIRLR